MNTPRTAKHFLPTTQPAKGGCGERAVLGMEQSDSPPPPSPHDYPHDYPNGCTEKIELWYISSPGAPLTYFNDGGPSDFFGSEILAKSDFFGSVKDVEILLGREK